MGQNVLEKILKLVGYIRPSITLILHITEEQARCDFLGSGTKILERSHAQLDVSKSLKMMQASGCFRGESLQT